jgi:2-amino-4-hydroxy-6-hydroxymethyldihydropteridine diphosphokinase
VIPTAYVSVGANIDPERHIRRGLRLLARVARVTAISTFYRTAPIGRPADPPFYNGVVAIETDTAPTALKTALREIETDCGRKRGSDRYAPRTLDFDIIWYDHCQPDASVTLPDPEIAARAFLAVPLAELAPELIWTDGRALREIAASFDGLHMEPLPTFTTSLRKALHHEYQTR